jgi:hypothetical protein
MPAGSLKDLEEARSRLEQAHERFARSSGSSTRKYPAALNDAAAEIRALERALKQAGVLARSEHELLEEQLDAAFPDATSSDVITHDGKRYRRRFFAVRTSPKGRVLAWGRSWEEVTSPD